MRSRVVVDPDGDVLLQPCQDQEPSPSDRPDNIEILVSWKPLSLASSVFRDGPFKQGIEHHKKSSPNERYEMPMKWDDGDALILLARIVHFKLADISDTPTAVELEKLMYLCDKYDCIDILKCFGILWIRALLRKYDDMEDQPIDDLCRLLVFAYVVDLWTEFTAIAWKIFLFHKGPFEPPGKDNSKINVLGNHRLVRHDLALHLNGVRDKCLQSLFLAALKPFAQKYSTFPPSPCGAATRALEEYGELLRSLHILGDKKEFEGYSVHDFINVVSNYEDIYIVAFQCGGVSSDCKCFACECMTDDNRILTQNLKDEVQRIREQEKTLLCLDCIKTNRISLKEGTCRLSHS